MISPGPLSPTDVSVVCCSINETRWAATVALYARILPGAQLIRIPDAKGLAEGYNRGLAAATGSIVVFTHDDVELLIPDLAPRLDRVIGPGAPYDIVGLAGADYYCGPAWHCAGMPRTFGQVCNPAAVTGRTSGYMVTFFGTPRRVIGGIILLDGMWFAARRDVARRIGFDQYTFDSWHHYDMDFSLRAHLAGCRIAVICDIPNIHLSPGAYDSPEWHAAAARFSHKFRTQIRPTPNTDYIFGGVTVPDKASVIRVVECPDWRRTDPQ